MEEYIKLNLAKFNSLAKKIGQIQFFVFGFGFFVTAATEAKG